MPKVPLYGYLFASVFVAIALPGAAQADTCSVSAPCVATYVQTSDESSPDKPVGINPGNKITVSDNGAGTLHIVTSLLNNWNFVATGASGNAGSFAFGLSSNLNLSFGANTPTDWGPTATKGTWQPINIPGGTLAVATDPVAVNALATSASGKFSFTNGYGLQFNSTGASVVFHTLDFTITGAGLTLASLVSNQLAGGDPGVFFLDVINNNRTGGPTGIINFSLAPVPLPPAALLFGTALVGLGILGRRRRKDVSV